MVVSLLRPAVLLGALSMPLIGWLSLTLVPLLLDRAPDSRPLTLWLPLSAWCAGKVALSAWFGWPVAAALGVGGLLTGFAMAPAPNAADPVSATVWCLGLCAALLVVALRRR